MGRKLRNRLGFWLAVIITFGALFVAFWMLELDEAEQLTSWVAAPVSILCIIVALIGAQVIEGWQFKD